MVKSDFYIKKIISIDTVLSFNGIIPSFSAFQHKMLRLVRQLQICLHKENVADTDIQRLCWLIAIWLDKRAETRLDKKFYHWSDYSLEYALYERSSDETRFATVFTELLENASQPVKGYAGRIALLYSLLTPRNPALMAALAAIPPQPAPASRPVKPTPLIIQPTEPPSTQPVCAPLHPRTPLAEGTGLLIALIALWILSVVYLGSLF